MKTNLKPTLVLGSLSACFLTPLARADFYQAPYGPEGKWRIYETTQPTQTFANALATAQTLTDPVTGTVPGNLVSVTSLEKNLFLYRSVGRAPGDNWIGLTDREGAAEGAFEGSWGWTNGDAFEFTNWGAGEPNNAGVGEDAGHMRGDTLWNDHLSGFGADLPIPPEVSPGTSTDETVNAPSMVYLVEYPVDSPTPFPGIRYGMVFPPYAKFNLPLNTAGNWSLREIRGLTLVGNVFDSIDQVLAGEGTSTDAMTPYLDFTDPDTNVNGGPVLSTAPFPYLTNSAGTDDDHVLSIARTRIRIDAGKEGLYTIQVRGDDGFALRIRGAEWASVAGNNRDGGRGYIDPMDPETLVFERGTGDANTMATINLAAGEYDVDFLNWEGTVGGYYEVSATSGDGTAGQIMQWQPFGSSTDLPAVNTLSTVRLAAPAEVRNANIWNRGNALPTMRYLFENAVRGITSAESTNLVIAEAGMPNNNGGDNYATRVTGQITLDADANGNSTAGEEIDVTFRLNCDDGASLRIIGKDFEAVNGGRTLVENDGDVTMTADFPTGDTDLRGRVKLKEGETYSFISYMYEYGGGSKYELYWELGDLVDTNLTTPTSLSDTGVLRLAAPAIVSNTPRTWDNQATLPNVKAVLDAVAPVIGTNAAVQSTLDIGENAMPNNNGGDNYATKVTGKITVAADANANSVNGETIDVTFRLSSDDGSNLRIIGQDFEATNGGTTVLVNVSGDMVLTGDFPTGDNNAIGRIKLVEGQSYDIESYMYEFGGGSKYQLFYEVGDHLTGLPAGQFLGSDNAQAVYLSGTPDPVGSPGVTGALVQNVKYGSRQSVLPHARAVMDRAIAQTLTVDGTVSTVVLRGDEEMVGRPGQTVLASSTLMPVGINQDYYITRVNGQIIVDNQNGTPGETLTLTFGIFSDDGMELRIVGQNFNLATDYSGDGVAYLSRVGNDAVLAADYFTGNVNAFGRIDLVEGTYSFEAHQFEGEGGASMEVWYAVGDKTAGFDSTFRPLNEDVGLALPANSGIPLIAGVDRDLDNDGMPTSFETTYAFNDADATDAAKDKDGDGASNLDEYVAGTNPNDPASVLRISAVNLGGGGIQISAPTKVGRHYRLYGSEDLQQPWTEMGRGLPTEDGVTTWTIPAGEDPPARYFFRVLAEVIE